MKLISPKQAQEQFVTKQSTDITQAAHLEIILKRLQDQINRENDKYEELRKEQRRVYSEEKTALRAELGQLEASVGLLKEQRASLLIPVDTLKKEAEQMHKEAQNRLEKIEVQELELESNLMKVSVKIDELADREIKVREQENVILNKTQGIEAESQMVSEGHMRLNGAMFDFNREVDSKTKELREREEKLTIEIQRAREYLELRTKEIDDKEKGLEDRRKALEREFMRLKNKNEKEGNS